MKHWSLEDGAELLEGQSAASVAAKIGRSETAVRVKASRVGKKLIVPRSTPRGKRILKRRTA